MKTFYSATDIEALASQGVRELIVDEDTVLTSVAREVAGQLGVKLVAPGERSAGRPAANPPATAANPGKPKGCQHGPLTNVGAATGPAIAPARAGDPHVVDDLIGAVKQLAKRGA